MQATKPPYLFQIDEIREHPLNDPISTSEGHWIPTVYPGWNYKYPAGVTDILWYCEGPRIRSLPKADPSKPVPYTHFKTFSLFYTHGFGFWALNGDGTNPPQGESWHALRFDHDKHNRSYVTMAGQHAAMQWQRLDQAWAHMLLPTTYHGVQTQNPDHGGLIGELPILLALVAMSMEPANLMQWIPWMFHDSAWQTHSLKKGWTDKRGVRVTVYLCPPSWATGGSYQDLVKYEKGDYGKYYN